MIRTCEAEDFAGKMVCGRCTLAWGSRGERPVCKERADPPITFKEMVDVALDQATEIAASQRALVNAGLRTEPYMPALRRAAVLTAIAALIERAKGRYRFCRAAEGARGMRIRVRSNLAFGIAMFLVCGAAAIAKFGFELSPAEMHIFGTGMIAGLLIGFMQGAAE